ncbi:MAG: hypothetical protein K0R61_118 [Microvirga sp.]|jgi:hypothetical protein|nr:hypothetical protein [Microvirga sp.]
MGLFGGRTSTVAVTIGTVTTLTVSTFITAETWSAAHTSTTGSVAVLMIGRVQATPPAMDAVTVGGVTITAQGSAFGSANGQSWVWGGTASGVPTGSAQDVVVDGSASSLGNIILFVTDLVSWTGGVSAGTPVRSTTAGTTSISPTKTLAGTGRRLLAIGGAISGACDPYSATGWTKLGESDNGPNPGSDASAALFTKVGGTAGATDGPTVTSATAFDHWAGHILELW